MPSSRDIDNAKAIRGLLASHLVNATTLAIVAGANHAWLAMIGGLFGVAYAIMIPSQVSDVSRRLCEGGS